MAIRDFTTNGCHNGASLGARSTLAEFMFAGVTFWYPRLISVLELSGTQARGMCCPTE